MKKDNHKTNLAGRILSFFIGSVFAYVTIKNISSGVVRFSGVERSRENDPFGYWFAIAVLIYLTLLLLGATFIKNKKNA